MTVEPPVPGTEATLAKEVNPWLNRKLLIGVAMVVAVLGVYLFRDAIHDTAYAYVGQAPINVVPAFGAEADPNLGFKDNLPEHPLGTDSLGRDILSSILMATPRTLWVGLIGAGIGMVVGIALGFAAGFVGGWVDSVISTVTDSMLTIPGIAVLVVVASAVDELDVTGMGLVMALFAWPIPTRLIRAQVLSMRTRGYVPLARLSGTSTAGIMFKEIMPNLLPYLAGGFTSTLAGVILAATGVETLGIASKRLPTLGTMVNDALENSALFREMWWWWAPPMAMLVYIFVAFFLVNLGLDEVANPRLRKIK